jgi:hypothetical protein
MKAQVRLWRRPGRQVRAGAAQAVHFSAAIGARREVPVEGLPVRGWQFVVEITEQEFLVAHDCYVS